jgi:hypothetical protein
MRQHAETALADSAGCSAGCTITDDNACTYQLTANSPAGVAVGVGWVVARACVSNSNNDTLLALAGVGAIHGAPVAVTNVGGPAGNLIAAAAAACSGNSLQQQQQQQQQQQCN